MLSRISSLLHRASEIQRERGFLQLIRVLLRFSAKRLRRSEAIPIFHEKPYYKKRVDNEYRWGFIKPHIIDKDSVIDIGCAEGYFVSKVADEGVFALGIERRPDRLSMARKRHGSTQNVGFANWEIHPDTIGKLPDIDVVLLLTVYHGFVGQHGKEAADDMLRTVARKSEVLIFEPPGKTWTDLELEVTAIETETREETTFELGPQPRNRPFIGEHLHSGKYDISVSTEGYAPSNTIQVEVGQSGKLLGERPRIRLNENSLELIPGEKVSGDITDMVEWYGLKLDEIFRGKVPIVESTVTDYRGGERRDPLFVLDTSDF